MISPAHQIKTVASKIGYPNGIVITPDGKHLIVAETFSAAISVFDITSDNTLINRSTWFKFDDLGFQVSFDETGIPEDTHRHYPDGICYDEHLDALWVTSPGKKEVLCVTSKGDILNTVKTHSLPFDCALGGKNRRTLYIGSSDAVKHEKTGKIEVVQV